jgi:hypothetical protein
MLTDYLSVHVHALTCPSPTCRGLTSAPIATISNIAEEQRNHSYSFETLGRRERVVGSPTSAELRDEALD